MTNAELHGCAFAGWQCFHCGEIFTTVGGAQDHFGADSTKKPGCLIKVALGDERGLLMDLRKAEDQLARLRAENVALLAANKDCVLHFETLKHDHDRLRADNQQLRQSAEVRDAEIARLETDLELARKGAERLRDSLGDALALIETITPIEGDTVRKCRAALEHTK